MKRIFTLSAITLLAALLLPLFFVRNIEAPVISPLAETVAAEPESPDALTVVKVLSGGEVTSCILSDYLPLVVAAEMPAAFEAEALKAQAVAARSYILYCMTVTKPAHPEADVCNNPDCCKAWISKEALQARWGSAFDANWRKITGAVSSTDGEYLSYEGAAICAVFHSSSAGMTEASGNVWQPLPYLVSVESPEAEGDVPNYISQIELSKEEFCGLIAAAYPEARFSGEPEGWMASTDISDSGRVAYCNVGGVKISGADMRRLFSLRSTAFILEYTGTGFLFTVRGYGHGVGLSQYGANVMAKQGILYDEILAHYYAQTVLCKI